NEFLGLVREVGDVVVAFLRRFRRLDEVVVVGQPRIILIGIAAKEAVIAIEATTERPPFAIGGQAHVLDRRQVPLADGEGGPAERREHFRQQAVRERYAAV